VHVLTSLAFSAVHNAVMVGLRIAVYAAAGARYHTPSLSDLVYEYRKDVLAYAVLGVLFWLLAVREPAPATMSVDAAVEVEPEPEPLAATFDIVEGARVLRMPVGQIVAVRAAGNYVEFLLDDGRRPLMRAALGEMEAALAGHDFLRTHRSWIVNPTRLRSLEAVGSGDYRLGLDGGAEAPLSRRFPAALERLREGR
jgi:DNA-binding LytR/AlgR family response regulator